MQTGNQPSSTIHIAVAFDINYIVHIYAMLTSLFHNNPNNKLTLHAIATGISTDDKKSLQSFIEQKNCQVHFYEISTYLEKEKIVIPDNSYFTIATFYRLFFASLVNENITKLLYIDPDTIIIGDLKDLYSTDTGNFPIAAVADSGMGVRKELGISEPGNYFNAGVMLINLPQWREQKISEKVIDYVKAYPERVEYLDQDGLNATLKNNWYRLDNKYNLTSNDVKLQVPIKELIKGNIIIHYTSSRKPWNFLTRNKLRYLYHHYLKMSPKSNEKKYVDFKWSIKSIYTFLRIRLKEKYFEYRVDKFLPIKKWMDPYDFYY